MPPDLEIYLSLLHQKILEDDDAIRELESEILKRQEAKRMKEMFVALLTKQQMAIENKDQLILELTQQIKELQPTNEYKIGTGTLYPREGDYKAAVIGFRAGMLAFLLEDHKATKVVAPFAEWVAEYVFRNQMELWGEQMERELTGELDAQSERGAATSLLGLLPKEFTTNDLIKLRVKNNQSVTTSSIKSLLSRWKIVGRIARIGDGKWKRLS